MIKILLATNNKGKAREFGQLLAGNDWEFVTLDEQRIDLEIEETSPTFEGNAVLKATAYSKEANLITLADDSGLEVNALNGEPGVCSARYAGPDASDAERNAYLLSQLNDVPWEERKAQFRCVIAVAFSENEFTLFKGECPGMIAFEPKGENGFGYDPVFWLPQLGKTMAELAPEEKNRISHRSAAARKARIYLQNRLSDT